MADPPRPPMSSLDAAWDDDPTFASDADQGNTDPDASAAVLPGAEPETRAVSSEELDQILDGSREGHATASLTVQLGSDEMDKLLAKGRGDPPPFASALEVPVAPGGGLPDADEVGDAFDRLEGAGPPPPSAPPPGSDRTTVDRPLPPPEEMAVDTPAADGPAPPAVPPIALLDPPGRQDAFPSNPFAGPMGPSHAAEGAALPPPPFAVLGGPPTASPLPPPAPSHPAAPAAWASPVVGTPLPVAPASAGGGKRPSLPAGISPRVLAIVVGAAAALAVVTVLIGRAVRGDDAEVPASSADSSPRLGNSILPPVPAPPTTVERSAGSPEDAAIKALERFRDGLVRCVRESIHVLPGTSPAIPASIGQLAGGGYASQPGEWKKPVWGCVHFSLSGPQRFQFQWQQGRVLSEGSAVAWVDADGDGKAERAFGFKAKLKRRNVVELGAIVQLDPMPSIASPR